ncbi:MAG: hypothetical protein WC208_13565 [Gallionella sp.]|jgi:hypothetical protein
MARVYKRKMVESQEHKVGQDGVREFQADGELNKPKSKTVDGHHMIEVAGVEATNKKWLDEMAFMNEIVTVRVHPTTDKNANPFPEVFVNGRVQRFVRGAEQKVRRCFVEVLARAKGTTFDNVKSKDPEGEDKYSYPTHTAEVYPFVVINDTPKGEAWLKSVLAQA